MTERLFDRISLELGVGKNELTRIIETAPARYKVYQIDKRHGGKRTIAQPSRELKAIQRCLSRCVLEHFPIHTAAAAYIPERSILDNALQHLKSDAVLKLDFTDFFPSLTVKDWERVARSSRYSFGAGELTLCNKVLFWGKGTPIPFCLSIGAPTSPLLSNIILFRLDTELSELAKHLGVVYTRYADDITASARDTKVLVIFESKAREIVASLRSPKLTFNDSKRGIYTRAQRRMVTGLILTPTGEVSIGRERKRLISAMLHRVKMGEVDVAHVAKLKGLLGFAISAEPDFVGRLRKKYGNALVNSVLRADTNQR